MQTCEGMYLTRPLLKHRRLVSYIHSLSCRRFLCQVCGSSVCLHRSFATYLWVDDLIVGTIGTD